MILHAVLTLSCAALRPFRCRATPKSIPIGVEFVPEIATHVAWLDMFERAQHSIDIAAFYFSLTDGGSPRTRPFVYAPLPPQRV